MAGALVRIVARIGRPLLWGGLVVFCFQAHLGAIELPLRWRWSNPSPHGNNIYDMAFSALRGLAVQVSEQGQLYSSSDLILWTPRSSGTTSDLLGVTFFGPSHQRILVAGESGTVLYADSLDHFQPGNLLDGPTTDWLEGVAASSTLAVAVGDNGAIYTSSSGIAWKRQSPSPPVTQWLRGVAYGNGYFMAAGDFGFVIRSPDGTNWTQLNPGTSDHFNRIHFGANRFTVVGETLADQTGFSLSSTNNGLSWVQDRSGASHALFQAGANNSARLLLGDQEVRLFQDAAWSDELASSNGPPAWSYYAQIASPNYFLIGGRTGLMAEGFKTNGNPYFWAQSQDSFRHWLFDMVYATNLFVAVGDRGTVMTSGDGVDWNLELVPPPATNSIFLGVGGDTNLLLAVGDGGSMILSPNILTNISLQITNSQGHIVLSNYTISSLGVLWFNAPQHPTSRDLQGVCFGHNLYVVTGDEGFLMTSPNGTNWTARPSPTGKLLSGVTSWPGGFVATGDDGVILTSPTGLTWSLTPPVTTNWIYKVRYLNGWLVAVGQNGTILTSQDGTQWNPQASGTTSWLTDATFIEDTFFAIGTQGTVLTSSNATTWTPQPILTRKSLYAAATDGARFIVGGVEGVILRSPVVPDLTPITILDYARILSTNTPNLIQNVFLFGGKPDQQFTLDHRAALNTNLWITGPQLEFFDSSGTLFYLETVPAAGAPPEEYYRATLP